MFDVILETLRLDNPPSDLYLGGDLYLAGDEFLGGKGLLFFFGRGSSLIGVWGLGGGGSSSLMGVGLKPCGYSLASLSLPS